MCNEGMGIHPLSKSVECLVYDAHSLAKPRFCSCPGFQSLRDPIRHALLSHTQGPRVFNGLNINIAAYAACDP